MPTVTTQVPGNLVELSRVGYGNHTILACPPPRLTEPGEIVGKIVLSPCAAASCDVRRRREQSRQRPPHPPNQARAARLSWNELRLRRGALSSSITRLDAVLASGLSGSSSESAISPLSAAAVADERERRPEDR